MKFKKILFGFTLGLFLSTSVVYAASSSDYFAKAQKYINDNCNKPHLSEKTSLDCYLFHKINEPTFDSSALKTFDANGVELGIYVDNNTFFYPPLNKLVNVNISEDGLWPGYITNPEGNVGGIAYKEQDCVGIAYLAGGTIPTTEVFNYLYPNGDGKYYVVDQSIAPSTSPVTLLSSYDGLQGGSPCSNNVNSYNVRTMKEVPFPLPHPIILPLQFKYQ